MITAIVKIQSCTTKPGRAAFVRRQDPAHGIAKGRIKYYEVTAPTWPKIRAQVAAIDSTGRRTMGFSAVGESSVESWAVSIPSPADARIGFKPLAHYRAAGTESQNA